VNQHTHTTAAIAALNRIHRERSKRAATLAGAVTRDMFSNQS